MFTDPIFTIFPPMGDPALEGVGTPVRPPSRANDTALLEQLNASLRGIAERLDGLRKPLYGERPLDHDVLAPVMEALTAFKLVLALNGIGMPSGELIQDPGIRRLLAELHEFEKKRAEHAALLAMDKYRQVRAESAEQRVAGFHPRLRFTS